jgi:hypothetical protein
VCAAEKIATANVIPFDSAAREVPNDISESVERSRFDFLAFLVTARLAA